MPADLARSNTVIVLFVQPGCPACAAFKPIFHRVARKYKDHVPVEIVDVSRPEVQAFCDAQRPPIESIPVMILMKRGTSHVARAEGTVDEAAVERFFYVAAVNAR